MTSAALRRAGTSVVMVLREEESSVRDWEPKEREFSTNVQQNPWTCREGGVGRREGEGEKEEGGREEEGREGGRRKRCVCTCTWEEGN